MKTVRQKFNFPECERRDEGFTLTDLLAVLAAVALLIVVCLPALAGTRDQTRVAQCAGNLRQFTLAMHIYGGEYNDKLPSFYAGDWLWDLTWNVGNVVTQWVSWRQLYCPGTSIRFTDQDNSNLWNIDAPSDHVINYAMAFSGSSALLPINQNSTLTPQRILFNGTYLAAPSPAQRVLLADATISIQTPGPLPPPSGTVGTPSNSKKYTGGYSYDNITTGAYSKPHLSPHLNGKIPAGGNVGMLDGHVEWRKFADMTFRGYGETCPVFWW